MLRHRFHILDKQYRPNNSRSVYKTTVPFDDVLLQRYCALLQIHMIAVYTISSVHPSVLLSITRDNGGKHCRFTFKKTRKRH